MKHCKFAGKKGLTMLENNEELSSEDLDRIADCAIKTIQGIIEHFDVEDVTIDEYDGDEGELILDITGKNMSCLIGRHGKTLDSLQLIVTIVVANELGFRYPVIVDVEGYKAKQKEKLENMARRAANSAVKQGRNYKMRPMSPYERRIIHVALRDDARVETASEGEGSHRHVVIVPTDMDE